MRHKPGSAIQALLSLLQHEGERPGHWTDYGSGDSRPAPLRIFPRKRAGTIHPVQDLFLGGAASLLKARLGRLDANEPHRNVLVIRSPRDRVHLFSRRQIIYVRARPPPASTLGRMLHPIPVRQSHAAGPDRVVDRDTHQDRAPSGFTARPFSIREAEGRRVFRVYLEGAVRVGLPPGRVAVDGIRVIGAALARYEHEGV